MSIQKDLFEGYKEISELEQTLIENLTVFKNLIKRMNIRQPKLSLTYILKKDICWIIGALERLKQNDCFIDYKIGWAKNTLKIFGISQRKRIVIITIRLVRYRLIHNNIDNIQFHVIGVQ